MHSERENLWTGMENVTKRLFAVAPKIDNYEVEMSGRLIKLKNSLFSFIFKSYYYLSVFIFEKVDLKENRLFISIQRNKGHKMSTLQSAMCKNKW